jgi:hypothetical protein
VGEPWGWVGALFRCCNTESRQEKKNIIVAVLIRSFVHDFKKEKMIFKKVDFIRSSEEGDGKTYFSGWKRPEWVDSFWGSIYRIE